MTLLARLRGLSTSVPRAQAALVTNVAADHLGDAIVDEVATVARHFGRRRIDEVAGIGRDHLHIDAVAVHVGEANVEIGQLRKVDLAALRLDAPGERVDMRVGVRRDVGAGRSDVVVERRAAAVARRVSRVSGSSVRSAYVSAVPFSVVSVRRSSARMRASNSSGAKGFTR